MQGGIDIRPETEMDVAPRKRREMTYVGFQAVLAHQHDEYSASFLGKAVYVEGIALPVRYEKHVARVGFCERRGRWRRRSPCLRKAA